MPKISIITDSDASLSPELEKRYNIRQVPITIHFDDQVFESNVDINDHQLFQRIQKEGKLPTTAAPSPGCFAKFYQTAFEQDQADALICFVVSSKISATYDAALIAANELMPDKDITVVDTLSLTLGQGFMAISAAEVVANGGSADEAVAAAEDIRERTHLFGSLSTLEYLAMGGRVSQMSASMAGMLNIKPILTIRNGKLEMLEKVRTRKKAWARAIALINETAGDKTIERINIVHTDCIDEAREFETLLRENIQCPDEINFLPLSPGLSVHTGPGFVGVSFITEK